MGFDDPVETYIEDESVLRVDDQESPTQRMIVLSNKGATETHFSSQEFEPDEGLEPGLEGAGSVAAVPTDDFLKINEFKAGGVAAVNRKQLLKQRSEADPT